MANPQSKKVTKYKTNLKGLFSCKGVEIKPGEEKELTQEQLEIPNIKHAIKLGILKAV